MASTLAVCAECAWSREASGLETEELAAVAVELEDHLASVHDLSYPRAQEIARTWARRVLFSEGEGASGAR